MNLPAMQVVTALVLVLMLAEVIGHIFDYSPYELVVRTFLKSFLMAYDTFDLVFQTKLAAQVIENSGNVALIKISNGMTIEVLRRNENLSVDDFNVKYAVGRLFPARATLQRKQSAI